jgi:hypothetical protein
MEYVIAAVVVVLVVAGFVAFMVTNATTKSGPVAAQSDDRPPGIGTDETPLGDTSQHAGRQTEAGTTVGPQDGAERRDGPDDAAHRARPGEAEGEERLRFEPHRPDAERLGNRDR